MNKFLTLGELISLTQNSKHKSIGRVVLYIDLEKVKLSKIEVWYKSGRRFVYDSCPDSVKGFLEEKTSFYSYITGNTQVVMYFMA